MDFDRRRMHTLTVQAQNVAADCQIARIRINIRVISNEITFANLPPQGVPENSPQGTEVVRVVASGGAGAIRYSITAGNVGGAFSIGGSSGRVTVNGMLDFEARASYTLTVRAESTGTTITGTTTLQISVLDINEPHSFQTECAQRPTPCTYVIQENQAATSLGRIFATDPDSSSTPNGTLRYRINNIDFPFSVNSQGDISTSRPLDREMRDSYAFALVVEDGCVPRCSITMETRVVVTVTDLNDNAPVFTLAPDVVQLSEDALRNTGVAQYRATDADIGSNAEIVFSLSPNNLPFSLSQREGLLTLTGDIDFETRQSYDVTITASNPGSQQSTSTDTTVQILNVNDNAPMFVGEPYSATIQENSPENTVALTVEATDADLGIHGEIRYSIIDGNLNDAFQIGSTNGIISVQNNIDREAISSFELVVRARDRGSPQRKSVTTTIPITITDVNDNPPVFQPSSYSVLLREDLPVGEDVVEVLASDADQPNTPNSRIEYFITGGNSEGRFRIDRSTGLVEIDQMLDFETTPSYQLTIEGRDAGSPVMTGTASITITVINVNEDPPTLMGDQEVDISELAPVGTTVAVFQALDPDQMAVTFTIDTGNEEGRFDIGSSSGEITTIAMLDYETTIKYNISIRASDGQQSTKAFLVVNVLDENEFTPVFSGPDAFSVLEEEGAGMLVGTVMATDADRDAVVTYSFLQQDTTTALFSLDSQTGVITTVERLDREALTQLFPPPSSLATLEISARDNGSPSRRTTRTFSITLTDINDNSPIFSDPFYANSLLENLPPGQEVFPAGATDADLGLNALITYSFQLTDETGGNPFAIDSDTGLITTISSLDCEQRSVYFFTITAQDMGSPDRRTTTVEGNLTVIDENDNAPIFEMPVYRLSLLETMPPGSDLLTLRATDADKGANGEVEYTVMSDMDFTDFLESSTVVTQFRVGLETGLLENINEFDFASASQINLTVFANDRGVPQLISSALVIIEVGNVDQQSPFFVSSCNARVPEEMPAGTELTRCLAIDRDSNAVEGQVPLMYSFTGNEEAVVIDSVTGVITNTRPLDRESGGAVSLTVIATDLVGLTASTRVVIRIDDINDNPPSFIGEPYEFTFSEEAIATVREFLTVRARDTDLGENASFTFSIGEVQRPSNREALVEVIATDMGNPSLSGRTVVTVNFARDCPLQEYAVSSGGGVLSASLLCSVEVMPAESLAVVLGGTSMLDCGSISNTPVSYQWLQNGTAITAAELVEGGGTVRLPLTNVGFSDAGDYACKVTTTAGSLQTTPTNVFLLGESLGIVIALIPCSYTS